MKIYTCPICNKNGAYESNTYPGILVHKCSNALVEVGSLTDGKVNTINKQINNGKMFQTMNFNILQVPSVDDLEEYYVSLGYSYAREARDLLEKDFNRSSCFAIKSRLNNKVIYLLMITNKKIIKHSDILSKHNDRPDIPEIVEVLDKLIYNKELVDNEITNWFHLHP